jgi:hypothetical protein
MQEQPDRVYHNKDLRDKFDITKQDAGHRLSRLRTMGHIRYASPERPRLARWVDGYVLTEWGLSYKFFVPGAPENK